MERLPSAHRLGTWLITGLASATIWLSSAGLAQALPEIRTHAGNRVPACVTPERLMRFLTERNSRLDPRLKDIARYYKEHGEAIRIRWDYAFYQMVLETNYLIFKNGAGQGDVSPRQNNFAGIGTTGGGVPGDSYPDVSTGVLAQMQHLTAYSGERVENPVGRRTREKQDDIIQRSQALNRPVTFRDLTRRWAVDKRYGASIEMVASRFRDAHCNGNEAVPPPVMASAKKVTLAKADPAPAAVDGRGGKGPAIEVNRRQTDEKHSGEKHPSEKRGGEIRAGDKQAADKPAAHKRAAISMASPPWRTSAEAAQPQASTPELPATPAASPGLVDPPKVARRPTACRVYTASYGGERNVLIRAIVGSELQYTALQVLDGQEARLAAYFIQSHARGGDSIGDFPSREAALSKAFDLCPSAERSG